MKHIEEALRVAQEARKEIEANVIELQRRQALAAPPPREADDASAEAREAQARARRDVSAEARERTRTDVSAETRAHARTDASAEALAAAPVKRLPTVDLGQIVYARSRTIDVPRSTLERARIIDTKGQDAATRAYKLLRTQVLQRMERRGASTLAIVSPAAREGKTLTAINLGVALASSAQHTVMLVDCDWRKPSVHTHFGYTPEDDVISYLEHGQPLSAAIVNPGIPRFCFLPCRGPVAGSSERLGSATLGAFVAELKQRYRNRIVIFDLPPMLLTDDALSFLPHVDCVLVVVEENRTARDELEKVLAQIGPERLLGTVLNKSSTALAGY